jgi:hypothetical protein
LSNLVLIENILIQKFFKVSPAYKLLSSVGAVSAVFDVMNSDKDLGSVEHPIKGEAQTGLWMTMINLIFPFNRLVPMKPP